MTHINPDEETPPEFITDIIIKDTRWNSAIDNCEHFASTLSKAVFKHLRITNSTEISVLFTSDAAIQILNRDYRGKDKPTNVLSFAQNEDCDDPLFSIPGEPKHIGDIILAYETIHREAEEQNKSLENHLSHMIIHGTLHLLGYDHEDDEEANIMQDLEIKILSGQGIKNPYEH